MTYLSKDELRELEENLFKNKNSRFFIKYILYIILAIITFFIYFSISALIKGS